MERKGYRFGSENIVTDSRPYFVKLFLDDLNLTEHLRIPPQFKKHVLQDMHHSSKVILKGPSGETRYVRVVKTDGNFFLKDGWKKFVRENSLGNNEFLLFTSDGNLRFNVQIFDVNGLERVSMPDPRKEQHQVTPDKAGPSCFRQPRELKGSTKDGCFEEKGKKKPIETNSRRGRKTNLFREACYKSSKKNTNGKEKTVKSFTSKHPYFEVRLKLYNIERSKLHIPRAFSQKYLPVEKTTVVLRNDHKEMTWEVNSIPFGDGLRKVGFYGGFGAFARDNNLKENDVCIFELVGPLEMEVHIFQSGSHT